MRTCEEYWAQISALMDKELAEKERLEVMEHMASCPACAQYFRDQLAIREAMEELEEPAPAGFADGVMERVRETAQDKPIPEEKKTVEFPHWRRWVATAACCAIAVAGVWAMGLLPGQAAKDVAMQSADVALTGVVSYSAVEMPVAESADDMVLYTTDGKEDSQQKASANSVLTDQVRANVENAPDIPITDVGSLNAEAGTEKSLAHTDAITTASAVAKAWVEEHLGEQWIPGCGYELTKEQFADLRGTLDQAGEPYTLEDGEEEAHWYLVAAK